MPGVIPFVVVVVLAAVQFLSDSINIERSKYREELISFGAAIAVTYLLFSFLPKAYTGSSGFLLFIPLISGFMFIHLLEKLFYGKYALRYSIRAAQTFHDELHALVLFIYHFVIGAVLINIVSESFASGML